MTPTMTVGALQAECLAPSPSVYGVLPEALRMMVAGVVVALVALVLRQSAAAAVAANGSTTEVEMYGWYACPPYSLEESVPEGGGYGIGGIRTEMDATLGAFVGSGIQSQCAIFKAPLCYEGVCEDAAQRTIDIFVKRYVTGGTTKGKPNIIFMQGGPGAASPAMESAMNNIMEKMEGQVNAYTMDHRGTGRSTKFDCVAAQAQTSGSPSGTAINKDEIPTCAQELEDAYGDDLSSFSVTSAASDLKYFISNFLRGENTFVYGVSYGTLLVERLMHLNTPGIKGYILDGIATTSGGDEKDGLYMSKWDINMDEVGEQFLSHCERYSDECGQYFDGSLSKSLKALLKNLDDSNYKCTSFLDNQFALSLGVEAGKISPSITLRQVLGILIKSFSLRKMIPILTYRLSRCNSDDQNVVAHFLMMLSNAMSEPSEEGQLSSSLLYGLIVYSELWESPSPTETTVDQRFLNASIASYGADVPKYCAFTKEDRTNACTYHHYRYGSYKASPISYKKDQYWNVAAKPPANVSVLLLSGKLDPQTPSKYGSRLFDALDTTNKKHIEFEFSTHGTLWNTPLDETPRSPTCGMQILASFLSQSGDLAQLEMSCIDAMPAFSFQLSDRVVSAWLNTTEAFTGEFVPGYASFGDSASSSSNSSTYQTLFVVAVVLFALTLIGLGVFVVKWRRAGKETGKKTEEHVYEAVTA